MLTKNHSNDADAVITVKIPLKKNLSDYDSGGLSYANCLIMSGSRAQRRP